MIEVPNLKSHSSNSRRKKSKNKFGHNEFEGFKDESKQEQEGNVEGEKDICDKENEEDNDQIEVEEEEEESYFKKMMLLVLLKKLLTMNTW